GRSRSSPPHAARRSSTASTPRCPAACRPPSPTSRPPTGTSSSAWPPASCSMKVYRRCTRPRAAEALPSDVVEQLALGLGTSVISGGAVWIGQRLTISRRLRRRRRFLGLGRVYPRAHIIVGRKYGSTDSIHENDVAAALEIGNLLRAAGGETVDIVPAGASGQSAPDSVEFCLSGPGSNPRTGAHLRRYLPALEVGDKDAYV